MLSAVSNILKLHSINATCFVGGHLIGFGEESQYKRL